MRLGIITGSGSYSWPGLDQPSAREVSTGHGSVQVTEGRLGAVQVVHLSRHGAGHQRLSNQVDHHANLAALLACGVQGVLSLTVCGAVDPALAPGSLVVFDDLFYPTNRLPDGRLCSWYQQPGDPARGHWIFDAPYSEPLRRAVLTGAAEAGLPVVAGGCYGYVDGPRFNTRREIAALAAAGVSAVSQTAGPEVVLAGEAELPLALVGYVTDYANGVAAEPEPVAALLARMAASPAAFAALVSASLPHLQGAPAPGTVFRFEQQPPA